MSFVTSEQQRPGGRDRSKHSNPREILLDKLSVLLDHCRQQRKTITYLKAADAIDVAPPHRIHQVAELLEQLLEHDARQQRPLRAALVVSKTRSGLPADGFFLKAQQLGLPAADRPEEFHRRCLDELF